MYARQEIPSQLTRLANCQEGVVTGEQARQLGVSRRVVARLIDSGAWQRLAVGIFLTSPAPPTWASFAWGGILLGEPGARLGPAASAHQWHLAPAVEPVDILTTRNVRTLGPWCFVRESPGTRTGRSIGVPPRLSAADTVIDFAATRQREGDIVDLVTDALRLRLTTPARLQQILDSRRRHPHRRLLTAMFLDADGIESGLELEYLREVERPHGLPVGIRNRPDPSRPHRIDVDYRPCGLLVELDGLLFHGGKQAFRDMRRDNANVLRGAATMRFGWWAVKDEPCAAAYQVHLGLTMFGYTGLFGRCRRCDGIPETKLHDLAP